MSGRWVRYREDARSLPGDARRAWGNEGVMGVWRELCRRTLDRVWLYRSGLVVEVDLPDRMAPAPSGIVIRQFTGPDWQMLGDLAPDRMRRSLAAAAAAGRRCYVAWRGSIPVGHTWASPVMERRYEGYELPLPPDTVYLWQAHVLKRERGRGIGTALVHAASADARWDGLRRGWMVIHPTNRHSLRTAAALDRAGARVLGLARRLQLLTAVAHRFERHPVPRPLTELLT